MKKNQIMTVHISGQDLTNTALEAIVRKAARDGARTVEFIYEPLLGSYLTVDVEEAMWQIENLGKKTISPVERTRKSTKIKAG